MQVHEKAASLRRNNQLPNPDTVPSPSNAPHFFLPLPSLPLPLTLCLYHLVRALRSFVPQLKHGLRFKLEVFKTPNRGWGVQSWEAIPAGALVAVMRGVVMK